MKTVQTAEPVVTSGLLPDEEKLMARVIDALKNWDHDTAQEPWSRLIESRAGTAGIPGDLEIKHLIWMALRKACLTCASKDESEYFQLVENLADGPDDADVADMELHINIDKQQQLAQMVFTISKKLYESAMGVIGQLA